MDEHLKSLGQTLRSAREAAGLSIRQLAAHVGVHHSYIGYLETGSKSNPSIKILQDIAEVLHLDANELLHYIGIKPSSVLPEPRDYFLRKLGVSADEADMFASLIEHQMHKRKEEPREETD